jgi:hypothetical protein
MPSLRSLQWAINHPSRQSSARGVTPSTEGCRLRTAAEAPWHTFFSCSVPDSGTDREHNVQLTYHTRTEPDNFTTMHAAACGGGAHAAGAAAGDMRKS